MELPWLMRIRIALAIAVGVLLIGIFAWPIAKPAQPFGIVTFPGLTGGVILLFLSIVSALVAYFLCWPFGRYVVVITVPAGLAIWAARTGTVASQLQQLNSDAAVRKAFFAPLKWEAIFWLIIILAGFLGVIIGQLLLPQKEKSQPQDQSANGSKSDSAKGIQAAIARVINPYPIELKKSKPESAASSAYLNIIITLIGSVLIAHLALPVLAQNVKMPDTQLGSIIGQPATAQIIFAVLVSFGISGFVFKYFLNSSFLWPTLSCAFLMIYTHSVYTKQPVLEHIARNWPAVFLPSATLAILPVQMAAIAALGSIVGYWLAVRFDYWRKHELKR
ncbi:MAG: hypothetical protein ACYSSI_12000 [Planctomycetota bacterium]|jgi:hypothetical protein